MKILDQLLLYLDIAAEVLSAIPGPIGAGALLADGFVKIAQKANAAHVALTGKPIDLSMLHELQPVPEPPKP